MERTRTSSQHLEGPPTNLNITNLGEWEDEEIKASTSISFLSRLRGRRSAFNDNSQDSGGSQKRRTSDDRNEGSKISEFTSKDIILQVLGDDLMVSFKEVDFSILFFGRDT